VSFHASVVFEGKKYRLEYGEEPKVSLIPQVLRLFMRGILCQGAPVSTSVDGTWYLVSKDGDRVNIRREV